MPNPLKAPRQTEKIPPGSFRRRNEGLSAGLEEGRVGGSVIREIKRIRLTVAGIGTKKPLGKMLLSQVSPQQSSLGGIINAPRSPGSPPHDSCRRNVEAETLSS